MLGAAFLILIQTQASDPNERLMKDAVEIESGSIGAADLEAEELSRKNVLVRGLKTVDAKDQHVWESAFANRLIESLNSNILSRETVGFNEEEVRRQQQEEIQIASNLLRINHVDHLVTADRFIVILAGASSLLNREAFKLMTRKMPGIYVYIPCNTSTDFITMRTIWNAFGGIYTPCFLSPLSVFSGGISKDLQADQASRLKGLAGITPNQLQGEINFFSLKAKQENPLIKRVEFDQAEAYLYAFNLAIRYLEKKKGLGARFVETKMLNEYLEKAKPILSDASNALLTLLQKQASLIYSKDTNGKITRVSFVDDITLNGEAVRRSIQIRFPLRWNKLSQVELTRKIHESFGAYANSIKNSEVLINNLQSKLIRFREAAYITKRRIAVKRRSRLMNELIADSNRLMIRLNPISRSTAFGRNNAFDLF